MTARKQHPREGPYRKIAEEVSLTPWMEYVGRVIGVTKTSITIEVVQRFSIPVSPDVLTQSRTLQKGNRVGILILDDGTDRIRSAPS